VQWLCKVLVLVAFHDGLSVLVLECNQVVASLWQRQQQQRWW
jgi:hypothetical protein